jgi:enoyl-[acyl-carrier protein] reductase I
MGFLAGKRALIVGVASERSIAWGIAQAMQREGAELAFSYPNDKMKDRVVPLADSWKARAAKRFGLPTTYRATASPR